MASKEDLARIGREGFEMVDHFFDNKRKNGAASAARKPHVFPQGTRKVCLYQYQPQQSHVYSVNPNENMKTYGVVKFNDGVTVMDYAKRNSAPMSY